MENFNIPALDTSLTAALTQKINQKTKPLGALGQLEQIALQIGLIQHTLTPHLSNPTVLVFAGDHGIATSGVSPYPQAVTAQMVLNFLASGAAINVFAKQNNVHLRVIDAGVNHAFAPHPQLVDAKVGMGTANFLLEPAMTAEQCEQALTHGQRIACESLAAHCNIVAFGEMGIGNTASASCLMSVLCNVPIAQCVGRGTGLDDQGLAHKTQLLEQAMHVHAKAIKTPLDALRIFGGFEIAMMVGAMLETAKNRAILLIDGFIASAALLVAVKLAPAILEYCIFAHCSDEKAHSQLLSALKAKPLLNLGLRLGEGTGAVLAYPMVQAAVGFLNEMASFESAGVSEKIV